MSIASRTFNKTSCMLHKHEELQLRIHRDLTPPASFDMTFWEHLIERGHPGMPVVARIFKLLSAGCEFQNEDPQTFEDVKDTLMPLGFDREELKQLKGLWADFVSN